MLRNSILLCVFFGIITLSSCGLSGPKPDKRINVQLELDATTTSEEEINKAIAAIKNRFEKFGSYPEVEKVPGSNILNFSLETHAPEERVLKFLRVPGQLEFYLVHNFNDMISFLIDADFYLKENEAPSENGPLLRKSVNTETPFAHVFMRVAKKDTTEVNAMLRNKRVLDFLPNDLGPTKFLWGRDEESKEVFNLYAVATNRAGGAPINGDSIEKAFHATGMADSQVINLKMNPQGAALWEELTAEAYENGQTIAIVIDDFVISAPGVTNGPITGGRTQISGDFTEAEAQDLAASLGAGRIPKMRILDYTLEPLR